MAVPRYLEPIFSEVVNLQASIAKTTPIFRSEGYKTQYHEWQNSRLFDHTIERLRTGYESLFYQDDYPLASVRRGQDFSCIVFHNITNIQTAQSYFLLDYLKEKFCNDKLSLYKSESWKRFVAEEGFELCQRYILRNRLPFYQRYLPARFVDCEFVIIETFMKEQRLVDFSIKHFASQSKPVFSSIDALMAHILK
jgi:hypothetical protein